MQEQRQPNGELVPGELYAGRYRIVMQVGKGGMGRVYLAEDIKLRGKARALKLTRPLSDDHRGLLLEAQMLSELEHAHLPAIVDYFPPDETGMACIVMDYIAGDTLAERFERYSFKLPFRFVLKLLIQLSEVLIYLHSRDPLIVFRDLKPANILLDRQERAVLVDFGIARRYRTESQQDTLQLGTPGFAAPEQLRGDQTDQRTDIYGLGALAYHLLSGGQFAIRHRGPLKASLQADVPLEFCLLLEQVLAYEPQRRIQQASDLNRQLLAIQALTREDNPYTLNNGITRPEEASTRIIAIASAYPGAGATFVTLAFSSSLARYGCSHAVVECPIGEPQLYSWLDGTRRMPKGAVFSDAGGLQAATPAWRKGHAAYYPSQPDTYRVNKPELAFTNWLRRLGVRVVLLDLSANWEDSELKEWLIRSVDEIWMVGSCYPAKWTRRRQLICSELQQSTCNRNIRWSWIANGDQAFTGRKQWLSLFPSAPAALVPELSNKALLDGLWSGNGIPTDPHTSQVLDKAFHKLISSVISQG